MMCVKVAIHHAVSTKEVNVRLLQLRIGLHWGSVMRLLWKFWLQACPKIVLLNAEKVQKNSSEQFFRTVMDRAKQGIFLQMT
jgi:hypothetical protein